MPTDRSRIIDYNKILNRAIKADHYVEVAPVKFLTRAKFERRIAKAAISRGLGYRSQIVNRNILIWVWVPDEKDRGPGN